MTSSPTAKAEGVHVGAWEEVPLITAGGLAPGAAARFPRTLRTLREARAEIINTTPRDL